MLDVLDVVTWQNVFTLCRKLVEHIPMYVWLHVVVHQVAGKYKSQGDPPQADGEGNHGQSKTGNHAQCDWCVTKSKKKSTYKLMQAP